MGLLNDIPIICQSEEFFNRVPKISAIFPGAFPGLPRTCRCLLFYSGSATGLLPIPEKAVKSGPVKTVPLRGIQYGRERERIHGKQQAQRRGERCHRLRKTVKTQEGWLGNWPGRRRRRLHGARPAPADWTPLWPAAPGTSIPSSWAAGAIQPAGMS